MKNIFFTKFLWRSVPIGATALTKGHTGLRQFNERIKILQPVGLISKHWDVPSHSPLFSPLFPYLIIFVSIDTSELYHRIHQSIHVFRYNLEAFHIFYLSLFIFSVYYRPMLILSCIGLNRILLLMKNILMK